jgi:hypothetical protein
VTLRRTSRRRHAVHAFVGGYTQAELYRRQLGEDALARAKALRDPDELLRRKPKVDQLVLIPDLEYRGRKPDAAELYSQQRRRAGRASRDGNSGEAGP